MIGDSRLHVFELATVLDADQRRLRSAEANSDPDFLVSQNGASGWLVKIISPDALRWTHERAKLLPLDDQTRKFETDLAGVNLNPRASPQLIPINAGSAERDNIGRSGSRPRLPHH
ncbi:hypothetical protein OF122_14620 [Pelagibacterium flavum]|uniref:Uncharacterized protein n=1 Tax=Pelagibacterium flavum TaxID=2984530 RepID=A0ABY6INI7_9HYPH|nr:hypothetical protein [Pelagibacterium sp. YIM 151497]UYQ71270.1 hypothetical protein OF122_14620 [Pelagibacterium sp. YIM 151497]